MKARFHPLSDLLLERYLAGELDAAESRRVEQLAAERPELEQHLRERRAEREAFKLRRPPLSLPAQRPSRLDWRWAFGVLGVAAAVALVVVLRPASDDAGTIATRGSARLDVAIAVQRAGEVFEYRDGMRLFPKDRLRLTVKAPGAGYLTVVDRDVHHPPQVVYEAVRISGETTLDDSLELDDTPGTEELVLFFTASPLTRAQALERAQRGATSDATVVTLSKGRP